MWKRTLVALLVGLTSLASSGEVSKSAFGNMPDGTPVEVFTLKSKTLEARVMTYGARIIQIRTPDRSGTLGDVMLGFDTLPEWLADRGSYNGSVVGRYGNRIAGGRFTIDGTEYQIPPNEGPNVLHGGRGGFDKKVWTAKEVADGVELTYVSPDGEMGFPGTLTAHVTYTVKGNALKIAYSATTDKPTVVNLTNHTYFNLTGGSEDVLGHVLTLNADQYTPVARGSIPTGQLASVVGTPLDFRTSHSIGEHIGEPLNGQPFMGYDHNFVLNGKDGVLKPAAEVYEPKSGRTMAVATTQPGVQFYSANFLGGGLTIRGGYKYGRHMGFCLETQHFPDSPNEPDFPSTLLRPGQTMSSMTAFTFGVKK